MTSLLSKLTSSKKKRLQQDTNIENVCMSNIITEVNTIGHDNRDP